MNYKSTAIQIDWNFLKVLQIIRPHTCLINILPDITSKGINVICINNILY